MVRQVGAGERSDGVSTRTPAELADALINGRYSYPSDMEAIKEAAAHLRSITPGGVVIPEPSEEEIMAFVRERFAGRPREATYGEWFKAGFDYARANARVAASVATVMAYEAGMRDGKEQR